MTAPTEVKVVPPVGARIGIFARTTGSFDEAALGPYIFLGVRADGGWDLRKEDAPETHTVAFPIEFVADPRRWATAEAIELGVGWFEGQKPWDYHHTRKEMAPE